jgi:hypothetical protein
MQIFVVCSAVFIHSAAIDQRLQAYFLQHSIYLSAFNIEGSDCARDECIYVENAIDDYET